MAPLFPPYRTRCRASDPTGPSPDGLPIPWAVRIADIAEARDLLGLLEANGASTVEVALGPDGRVWLRWAD